MNKRRRYLAKRRRRNVRRWNETWKIVAKPQDGVAIRFVRQYSEEAWRSAYLQELRFMELIRAKALDEFA